MARKIIVSLISDQTIPNVEFIKEFEGQEVDYLFITTKQKQKQLEWILSTNKIDRFDKIEVDAFDKNDILNKIETYDFGDSDIMLNITGGTKLMSLVVNEFLRGLGASIFYLTGHEESYIKIFPNRGVTEFKLQKKLLLNEYLEANGFKISPSTLSYDFDTAEHFLNYFTKSDNYEKNKTILRELQKKRSSKKKYNVVDIDGLKELLQVLNIKLDSDKLDKYDARYITGDWFEEYIYYRVKKDLNLLEDEIGIGYKLNKEGVPNEIDVLFVYGHKLYIIECKTSFYDYRLLDDGSTKKINLLGEIIYKSDALKSKFGLFARTYILTLGEMRDDSGEILNNFKTHIDRAELSKIQIISRKEVLDNTNMKELLKIK